MLTFRQKNPNKQNVNRTYKKKKKNVQYDTKVIDKFTKTTFKGMIVRTEDIPRVKNFFSDFFLIFREKPQS